MTKLTEADRRVLAELAEDNPRPEEQWQNVDPPWPRKTLRRLEAAGLVEVMWRDDPRMDEVRFTPAGRDALVNER